MACGEWMAAMMKVDWLRRRHKEGDALHQLQWFEVTPTRGLWKARLDREGLKSIPALWIPGGAVGDLGSPVVRLRRI
jgi:hypothetical protein